MGSIDRILRVFLAAILVALYADGIIHGTLGMVLIALSAIFVLTSMIGFCPLYLPFKLSTIRKTLHNKTGATS